MSIYLAWFAMQATRWANRQVDKVSPMLWISSEIVAIIAVKQLPPLMKNNYEKET